ncbi:MAG: cytochrome c [Bdellovibrionales bacterium]|nr:cytochrome c [Bdellovibrionales bacterium]
MSADKDYDNKGGKIAFIFSMVFSIGLIIYLSFLHPGVKLDEVRKEALKKASQEMAQSGGEAAVAFDMASVKEPWVSSDEIIKYGAGVFKTNCAVCHGNTGHGDGPAGAALKPPPRNFVEGKWTVGGDRISLHKTITEGITGSSMAPFGHIPVNDRWALVHFIRSITKNKVADDDAKVAEYGKSAK